jgi:hypothetical protein
MGKKCIMRVMMSAPLGWKIHNLFGVREQSLWKWYATVKHERDRQHDLGTLM